MTEDFSNLAKFKSSDSRRYGNSRLEIPEEMHSQKYNPTLKGKDKGKK